MFTKDCPAIIVDYPSGRFGFAGRVPAGLSNKTFASVDDAKIAAIDLMLSSGETFAVDMLASLKSA